MEEFMNVIRHSFLFTGVNESEIRAMLKCLDARQSEYVKGEYLLRIGEDAGSVGLLLCGGLLVSQEDFWGNRNIVSRVVPGQLFAESFACSPGAVMNVSVTAEQPCSALWLDVKKILTTCPTACPRHSRVIRNLISALADKNLGFYDKLTHIAQRTTREKLLSYLSSEAQRAGSASFDIPFNRQQLADFLSVERSAMSAELGRLRDEGRIECVKNHFVLK